MQIEFYHHFIRFLARLAEVVISLLRTLKNNLSDLVVTFARSAFQRNSAVIKVFLVSVVVALGGTWQDLDLLGPELAESGVKYALLPFFIKIKGRLSGKAKRDEDVNKVINEMNRLSESMKGVSTEKAYQILKQILGKEKDLNKALHKIDEPDIKFQGAATRTGDEAVGYGEGLHDLGVYSQDFKRAAQKLDLSGENVIDSGGRFSTFPNTEFRNLDKRFRRGEKITDPEDIKWAPYTRSIVQAKDHITQVHNNLANDRGFYRYIYPDDHPNPKLAGKKLPPPGFILYHVKGTKLQKIKKLISMQAEMEKNPREFFRKYSVSYKPNEVFKTLDDMPNTPLPRPKGERSRPKTKTNILTEEQAGLGRYPLAVSRRKEHEFNFDDTKEAQAKKQKDFEEAKAALDAYKRFMREGQYEKELSHLKGRLESNDLIIDILESAAINLDNYPSISKNTSAVEAFRALKGKDKKKFSAMIDGDIYSNRNPHLRIPDEIRSDGMLTKDTLLSKAKIIPDEDGSIPVDFTKSVLEDVDATDVTDWSKTKFGDVKSGSVAVLRGMQLSEEGAKSFKKHHNNKIHLLSPEEIEKHKEIFGDYLNRQ